MSSQLATSLETIHTTTAANGTSHDDVERVRIVLGNRPTESIDSAAQLVELIDRAVSSGRLPEDDRDAAYRACCEHILVNLLDRAVSSGRLSEDDRDAAYRACCEHLGVDA